MQLAAMGRGQAAPVTLAKSSRRSPSAASNFRVKGDAGFPIAKTAAQLAVGYLLDELKNDITRETPA